MVKSKTKFICQSCGYESLKWMGKCPGCNEWNTLVEELVDRSSVHVSHHFDRGKVTPITKVEQLKQTRLDTQIRELNRVLGGGLVPGSFVLVGGDPGIGKSTLLLQATYQLAKTGVPILYVSGEESIEQIRLRADRLDALHQGLMVASETNLFSIEQLIRQVKPKIVVIDSIQTMIHPEVTSAAGSVAQVRECTSQLMRWAKEKGIAVLIVGHVTKSGTIAGPRMLEHMVDCVLYFEGERHYSFRVLRAVKNRFGSTNEIGVFEMKDLGLAEVENPSEIFLSGRPLSVPGTTVTASVEGTRPVLVELQALVAPTNFPSPKRMATGVDHHRVAMIIAVLEKRLGLFLQNQDAYINVVGGVRLDEPAVDLSIAVALASSFKDKPTKVHDLCVGEIGLTGEVRAVSRIEQRIAEAVNMGFERIIFPEKNLRGLTPPKGIEMIGISTVEEALVVALGG